MRLLLITVVLARLFSFTTELGELGVGGGERTEVKVGALFFKDEEEIELGFDEAFREINNMKFFELSFVPIKRYVPTDDSFVLQQLTCELLANGVAAIFGPSSKASSGMYAFQMVPIPMQATRAHVMVALTFDNIVALIANATGIPHVQYDWRMETPAQEQLNHRMSVNVAPSLSVVSRAYLDIIKNNFEWKTFTIFYDTEAGLARLEDLLDIQSLNRDFIKLRKISDYQDDYRVLWKEAAETYHEHRLILDCEPALLETLLNEAKAFDLLGPFRNWFLTHLDTHSSRLRYIYDESFKANITSVRMKVVDPNPYDRKKTRISRVDEVLGNQTMLPILIYDAVILFANSARNIIASINQYKEPYKRCEVGRSSGNPWFLGRQIVLEMKTISEDDVEPAFKTENMRLDENGERTQFHLEIYKPTVNDPLALWKPDAGITPLNRQRESQVSSNTPDFSLAKKLYIVATHFEEPYFMLKADHENFRGIEKYEGYSVDLISKLSEILEFDYDFLIEKGNGKYDPETREWDGIIRRLIDNQAHIGACEITITQTRRQVVDFTVPFMQLGISILYKKVPPEPEDLFAFLKPFAMDVWLYMMITQLVMTFLFVLMARISNREWENPVPYNPDPDEVENKWDTMNSFWLMIGSIMQQGCDILPRGPPMRILNGMWWFFALMMLNSYTANLAASLTSNKMQRTIKDLQGLVDQDKVKYGTMKGGSTSLFFSESNDTLYYKTWNQMKSFTPSSFTSSNKEGVARVLNTREDYAFLMETTSLQYNIERNCELAEIGSQIGEKHYGLAVPLGAAYRTNLSVSILQLSEKGELYKLKNKWWKQKHNITCEQPHAVDGDELSIVELGGVFLVLAGGILIAVFIGICEFLWNVQRVAVEERVTPGEAFIAELLFAVKFWISHKPMRISSSSSTKSSSATASRRSSGQSRHTIKTTRSQHKDT